MGGKVWSTEEERVFWEVVIPCSPAAANPSDQRLSWKQCVDLMVEKIGDNARREYTSTMLYEHHYQNFKPGAKSPKANRFLERYMRHVEEWYKEHISSPPPSPPRPSTLDNPLLAAFLNEQSKPKSRHPRKIAQIRERRTQSQTGLPSANESGGEASGYSTPAESKSRSFTPVDGVRQQPTQESKIPVLVDPETQPQTSRYTMPKPEPIPRPGAFLNRPAERLEGGFWRLAPQTQQNERLGDPMPMAPRSTNPQLRQSRSQGYESPWTEPAAKPPQPQKEWNGKLPSIREMLPFVDFGRQTYAPYPYETTSRASKRSFYDDRSYESNPKRRRLPDRPIPQNKDERQPPRQLN
ncbi:hypothetical protein NW762_009464 [Fusarium torreyae]|uniref:Uncharacterized protein n=1 Tax=Fusarium torreyae TaxID=1237075 RepID=A0A9W8RXC0_9HYPO|nr:hypothetical protein NW762_009464 [Fusarium torreyae]